MAEQINTADSGKKRPGGQRSKKRPTRVDLTPMVDLGFLLITFFIFTTTMSRNTAMRLILPADSKQPMPVGESNVLTIIPLTGDSLYCYEGADPKTGNYISTAMEREVILRKKATADPEKFMIVVRPSPSCRYGNIVKLLDEFLICDIRHYVMVDATPGELFAMNRK